MKRRLRFERPAAGAIVAWIIACAPGDSGDARSSANRVHTRDSAGIAIVEHAGLDGVDSVAWTVEAVPSVVIGQAEGEEPYLFTQIGGALRQRDGTIVVADQRTFQIRFFDSTGKFLRQVGGRGQGPGEFNGEYSFHPLLYNGNGDSLIVRDSYTRVHLLDADGQFIRRHRITARDSVPNAVDRAALSLVFDDGSYLVLDQMNHCGGSRSPPGPCEIRSVFRRVLADSSVAASFGELPVLRFELARSNGIERLFSDLQSPAYWDVHRRRLIHGDSRSFEYRVFHADGSLERIVRASTIQARPEELPRPEWVTRPGRALPMPGAPSAPAVEAFRQEVWANAHRPERLRAYDGLIVDRVGNVWIREYLVGRGPSPRGERWWVFDSLGVLRHAVRVPSLVGKAYDDVQRELWPQPVFIDNEAILAVSKDADRVPRLNVFRISKAPPAP